jgi:glycosyltransferase involved in cell wall biosynthesis
MTAEMAAVDGADLKVMQLIPTTKAGGLERMATSLSRALARRVDRVVVCSAGGAPFEALLRAEERIGFVVVPRPRPRPVPLTRCALAVARVLRAESLDVVHAHNPAAAAAAVVARRLAARPGVAVLTTYHGVTPARLGRATNVLARGSDRVVAVGAALARELQEAGLGASQCVPNGITVAATRSPREVRREFGLEDAELIVSVGRLRPEKNQRLLVEAMAQLAPRRPGARALLVGAGQLEGELRRRVDELGLTEVVRFAGHRDDAVSITAAADVFALPSEWEGMPLALLEAMALGRPIVATAVRGVTDVVSDGDTGLLIPRGDAAALAGALERVLGDDHLRARLAANAAALAAHTHTEDRMVGRYVELYREALEERR